MVKDRSDGQAAAAGFPLTALFLLTAFCSVMWPLTVPSAASAAAKSDRATI